MAARGAGIGLSSRWVLPALVFVTAFAARLGMVYAHGGSVRDSPSYDTSVYYAAADAFVHGRMPYRDFTLVHPPGVMLALAPFAEIGRLTSDHLGFILGNLAWMVLGAVNSVLVMRIARRMQFGTVASIIGAFGYALWYESTRTEYAVRLEPLANFFVLLGILALVASARSNGRLMSVGCGAALGAAASVKIWYVVPLAVVLGWHLVDKRPRRQLGWAGIGTVGALVAINGPFFLMAGRRMWLLVVTDQVGRRNAGGGPFRRLAQIASSGQVGQLTARSTVVAVDALGALVFVALCTLAWRSRAGRLVATLAVVQLAVMMLAPTFFPYYADYLAPAISLTVAAAAAALLDRSSAPGSAVRRRLLISLAWLPVVFVGGSALAIDVFHPFHAVSPAPDTSLRRAVSTARCVQSDTPMALIQLDVLSRDLTNRCQLWVDVTGRSYAAPLKPTGRIHGKPAVRTTYPPWQHAILRYLLSGNAVVVVEPHTTGISRKTMLQLNRGAVLGQSHGYVVHRT